MSATEIVARAAALHVRLWSDGERVGMEGPATSIATIKPQVAANKSAVLAYLLEQAQAVDAVPPDMTTGAQIPADCIGALAAPDGGLFLP
ncbi:hypothetical protein [Burkholderia vietnamiensis]|nr:hypothetical protein [Burkholderia vietnamiensis]GBH27935.1 hypothetical protein BvRS1_49840 [Burkholderia vietnamiensis]